MKTNSNLVRLTANDAESGALNVIIEMPKGSRNKYAYEEACGLFVLRGVLPAPNKLYSNSMHPPLERWVETV